METLKILVLVLAAGLILTAGTCDHTRLMGEIALEKAQIHVGERVTMILKVPGELDNIHGVMWDIVPGDLAGVEYNHLGHSKYKKIEGSYQVTDRSDRQAVLIPKKPGTCTIEVAGFFKQTNPQMITRKVIEILAADTSDP